MKSLQRAGLQTPGAAESPESFMIPLTVMEPLILIFCPGHVPGPPQCCPASNAQTHLAWLSCSSIHRDHFFKGGWAHSPLTWLRWDEVGVGWRGCDMMTSPSRRPIAAQGRSEEMAVRQLNEDVVTAAIFTLHYSPACAASSPSLQAHSLRDP